MMMVSGSSLEWFICTDTVNNPTFVLPTGEHERPIWPSNDREPAASPLQPGRSGSLPLSGFSGSQLGLFALKFNPENSWKKKKFNAEEFYAYCF